MKPIDVLRHSIQMRTKTATPPQNLPHTYSRVVRRVELKTSTTWSSMSRITDRPEKIARNQAPNEMIIMD